MTDTRAKKPSAEEVKAVRTATGLTLQQAADRFGYSYVGWQAKELRGENSRGLSPGEFELLQLLANQHPEFTLIKKMGPAPGLPLDPDAAIMWKEIPAATRDAFCWMCSGKWLITLGTAEHGRPDPVWNIYLDKNVLYKTVPVSAFFVLEDKGLLRREVIKRNTVLVPTTRGLNTYLKALDDGHAREIK